MSQKTVIASNVVVGGIYEYPSSEQMAGELRAFAVNVARNWREASPEHLSAMVEVAKVDTQIDKLGDLISKLAEADAF